MHAYFNFAVGNKLLTPPLLNFCGRSNSRHGTEVVQLFLPFCAGPYSDPVGRECPGDGDSYHFRYDQFLGDISSWCSYMDRKFGGHLLGCLLDT